MHHKRVGNLGHDTCAPRKRSGEKRTKPCQEHASEIISLPIIRERFIEVVRGGLAASHTSSSSSITLRRLRDRGNLSDQRPDRFVVWQKPLPVLPATLLLSRVDQLSEIYSFSQARDACYKQKLGISALVSNEL